MTDKLPLRARELLSSANASGRYFEFYAARNYYERSYDHDKTALHAAAAAAGAAPSASQASTPPTAPLPGLATQSQGNAEHGVAETNSPSSAALACCRG